MSFIDPEFDNFFAKTISALEPYLDNIVCVGGCATALYRYHKYASRVPWDFLGTMDLDVAVPQILPLNNRPPIAELMNNIGLKEIFCGNKNDAVIKYAPSDRKNSADIEFLCDLSGLPQKDQNRAAIKVQKGFSAQPLRYLAMSLENTWNLKLKVIPEFQNLKDLTIQVPNPAAYIVSKILVRDEKRKPEFFQKDCFYIYEVSTTFRNSFTKIHNEYNKLSPCTNRWKKRFEQNARTLFADEYSEGTVNAMGVYKDLGELKHPNFELTEEIVCRSVNKMLDYMTSTFVEYQ